MSASGRKAIFGDDENPWKGFVLLAFDRTRIKLRRDSKSGGLYGPWGFDSPLRHHVFNKLAPFPRKHSVNPSLSSLPMVRLSWTQGSQTCI